MIDGKVEQSLIDLQWLHQVALLHFAAWVTIMTFHYICDSDCLSLCTRQ